MTNLSIVIDIEYDVETVSYYENIKIYEEKGSVEFLDSHEQFATRKYPVSAAKRFLVRYKRQMFEEYKRNTGMKANWSSNSNWSVGSVGSVSYTMKTQGNVRIARTKGLWMP